MRILSALIITYCCGCVIPENFYDDKRDDIESLQNSLSSDILIQIGNEQNPSYNCGRRTRRHAKEPKSRNRNHRKKSAGHKSRVAGSRSRYRVPYAHRKIKNAAEEKEESHGEKQNDETVGWDDWGEWTKCSVTCGNGRQVRWRHCTSEKCPIRGLKRAQMKTCHFEDCPRKGVLSWLGIKSH